MLINMAVSLIEHEQIHTTITKAKSIRPFLEKLITKAIKPLRENSACSPVHSKRYLLSKLFNNKKAVAKLSETLAQRYKTRPGGYIRIIKADFRQGDRAEMAYVQLLDKEDTNSS